MWRKTSPSSGSQRTQALSPSKDTARSARARRPASLDKASRGKQAQVTSSKGDLIGLLELMQKLAHTLQEMFLGTGVCYPGCLIGQIAQLFLEACDSCQR